MPGRLDPLPPPESQPEPEPASAPKPRRWATRRGMVLAAGIVVVLALAAALAVAASDRPSSPQAQPSPSPSPAPPTTAEIYAAVAPSVVSVVAQDVDGNTGSGTGVVVSADAMILTALHVVEGASTVIVTYADGTPVPAAVVAADPAMDIAVLQPGGLPEVLVPAVLGSAGRLGVGDRVIAIGDQLGLTRTTTEGVVSGLDRAAETESGARISGLIQFDAAVNHGSSGGPLVNATGEVVGIVVALANPTDNGTFIGISFAVPIGAAVTAGGGPPVPQ